MLQQSRRHAYIGSLLGIPHLAVCINKMDLVNFDKKIYDAIREEFQGFVFSRPLPPTALAPLLLADRRAKS